ncbi:MAG: hypothetical protein COA97_07140 [Flavobacteriales bacterium]|nr:MAG: hypothetical protein COA97_07140 [Flavobacteriales bacterium]
MKKFQIIPILAILVLQFGCSKEDETITPVQDTNSGPPYVPPVHKINDIYFLDANVGYFIGTSYDVRPAEMGPSNPYGPFTIIYKTTDGGNSWLEKSKFDCGFNGNFGKSILFTSPNDGFCTTSCDGLSIWNSFDGGLNWPLKIGGGFYSQGISTCNIDNNTFILGGTITRNNGQSFSLMSGLPYPNWVSSYSFSDTTYGVCAATNGLIRKTIDLGNIWDTLYNNPSYFFNSIYLTNNNTIFAGSNGEILKSNDGGNSWNTVYSNPNDLIKEIEFVDNQIGFAVTTGINCDSYIKDCPSSRNGKILKTIDGGATWIIDYSSNTMDFYCLKIVDQNNLVAAGINNDYPNIPILLHYY